jgi:SnoaL-like protein
VALPPRSVRKLVPLLLLACAHAAVPRRADVDRVLCDWHAAAAAADEARYFSHFAREAVFFGTDPGERWEVSAFRAYAHPHFAKGKAWSFRAVRREVFFSADGGTAWIDEDLDTPNLGRVRGTGVLVLCDGKFQIAQYNLSVPIPNALFPDVKRLIETAR